MAYINGKETMFSPLQSIEVDVKLQAEKKVEITANGVHEINADSGYNGIVKVVANVDIPNEEQYLGEYIDGTIYKTGAIVSYNGNIYRCIKDLDDMQDPTNAEYWQMLNEVIPEISEALALNGASEEEGEITIAYDLTEKVALPAATNKQLGTIADTNFIASNIKSGVSIFGRTGTYEGGTSSPIPIEISTEAEMNALLESASAGSVYKYIGETTDAYKQKGVYMLTDFGGKAWMELYVGDPSIELPPVGTSLEDCTWREISAISAEGLGEQYFNIGDTKSVHLQGTVGTIALDRTLYVYIIGFNHNSVYENSGIVFGTFKTANGVDVCLVDSKYNSDSTDGTKYFNMNHWGNYNCGGWAASDLRYDVLGSTDVAPSGYGSAKTTSVVGYDPTETCATNPVENTLMAALPAELRAVMKPMTIYTDNTGNESNVEANVTASVDYLPLLAEYEIFGARKYANNYEQNKQAQYDYYAAGNRSVKYRHSSTGTAASWMGRSATSSNSNRFCCVDTSGKTYGSGAYYAYGLAPVFKV